MVGRARSAARAMRIEFIVTVGKVWTKESEMERVRVGREKPSIGVSASGVDMRVGWSFRRTGAKKHRQQNENGFRFSFEPPKGRIHRSTRTLP